MTTPFCKSTLRQSVEEEISEYLVSVFSGFSFGSYEGDRCGQDCVAAVSCLSCLCQPSLIVNVCSSIAVCTIWTPTVPDLKYYKVLFLDDKDDKKEKN